ncbi:MAG: hypothetical protein LBF61_11150 [Azoarcus sp.]|nr:hypothetical protein [Azoarcus sp.]
MAASSAASPSSKTDEECTERLDIDAALDEIEARAARQHEKAHQTIERIGNAAALAWRDRDKGTNRETGR